MQRLAIGSNPSNVQLARGFTRNSYDEAKPDGAVHHLLTTSVQDTLLADGNQADTEKTVNGYSPIDGASATGPTSGWQLGSPTVVTGNADGGTQAVQAKVSYDNRGRAVTSQKNGSTGADAGSTQTIRYTALANTADAACGLHPEWAGNPCLTQVAGAVTGADSTRSGSTWATAGRPAPQGRRWRSEPARRAPSAGSPRPAAQPRRYCCPPPPATRSGPAAPTPPGSSWTTPTPAASARPRPTTPTAPHAT